MDPFPIIDKGPELALEHDYNSLLKEGLAQLRHLSGLVWTDYNEHDPGVTLLEALCFQLTDLGSRATLSMPTLLAPAPGAPAPGADLLVPAHEAFANHPVTLHDYRKLLLDRLPFLKNAWLSPASPSHEPVAYGHYEAHVELHQYQQGAEGPSLEEAHDRIRARVLHELNTHRNLGEVFVRVVILRPYRVVVGGHLALSGGQVASQVLAALLRAFEVWIAPPPAVVTVADMRSPKRAIEDLFAGPIAKRQLFDETSFEPRRRRLDCPALGRVASQQPSAQRVSELRLYKPYKHDKPHWPALDRARTHLKIPRGRVAVLDVEASLRHFTVSQQGIPLAVDPNLTHWAYRQLQPSGLVEQLPTVARAWPHQEVAYAELGHYDSVQHLLPPLYGTSEEGPPAHTASHDRAYIMQLKGYLLLFDQVMANFCAQLENVGRFFSAAPQTTTAYSGLLYSAPYVAPLLPDTDITPDAAWHNNAATAYRWQAYQNQPHNLYQRTLRDLAGPTPATRQRRGTFLAHLLARFGYTAQQYHARQAAAPAEGSESITAAERLLTHLKAASYHRGAARGAALATQGYAESGLEFFLFLLTGLETLPRRWARGTRLVELEGQVQLEQHASQLPGNAPTLVVRGEKLHFAQLLGLLAHQLVRPTLEPVSATTARLPAQHWELELVHTPGEPPAPATLVRRLLDFASRLDVQMERFTVLDHLVLKPRHDPEADAAADFDQWHRDADFFHCHATVLLPGYTFRFRQHENERADSPVSPRTFVENLIREHAPAHLFLNILWLDYPAMYEWELLYADLAAASDLLNPSGQADHAALGPAQHRARRFLEEQLPYPH